ncbi:MAG: hypothetical protein E7561_00170 [Ruminococcaceae bacterium]|nr:hypothetical protein [Oscillospiraceae bacterium]
MSVIFGKDKEKNYKYSEGCDFVLELGEDRKDDEIRVLQLTDMQIIDATQRRTPDRLRHDEITAWERDTIKGNCYDHISSIVTQTNPDLIFITGDIVYGSFDDSGEILQQFIDFMDSFAIPWTAVYGNHDNESKIGMEKQCEMYENGKYCMFKRGTVSGNSNFTLGISVGGELKRVMYMLDSHGALRKQALLPDQIDYMKQKATALKENYGTVAEGFMACHIPVDYYKKAAYFKGYATDESRYFNIGVDVKAKDGDFGFDYEAGGACGYIETDESFSEFLKLANIKGVFVGHHHSSCASIVYEGIRWTYGLKTGQYDYHIRGQIGGTLITVNRENGGFKVQHIPSLVKLNPFPALSPTYKDFFVE